MTGSERPSPEPLLKKEASPAVLGGREFWKCSGAFKCLELQGLGHPSRTLEGNSRKRSESVSGLFPEFFRNFLRKVPAVLGVWPIKLFSKQGSTPTPWARGLQDQIQKKGAPETENPFRTGFTALRGGVRPWSQTMVSEGARAWGRGRSEFAELSVSRLLTLRS